MFVGTATFTYNGNQKVNLIGRNDNDNGWRFSYVGDDSYQTWDIDSCFTNVVIYPTEPTTSNEFNYYFIADEVVIGPRRLTLEKAREALADFKLLHTDTKLVVEVVNDQA